MKKENFNDMNTQTLEEKLQDSKLKLLNLRSDFANRKLKNVHEISLLKKEVARILTAINAKSKTVVKEIEAETK